MGRYRILIILKLFNCDTHMLYFLVVAKFFVITLRVRTSDSALVYQQQLAVLKGQYICMYSRGFLGGGGICPPRGFCAPLVHFK